MLLLAVDTSSRNGSVVLARGDPTNFSVLEQATIAGGTFSAQLVPTIEALLQRHQVRKNDLELLAVASGPGSFTGLRIGLAAVKGLAEVLHTPVVAVSVLDAFLAVSRPSGRVAVMLDALRDEFYLALYESSQSIAPQSGQAHVSLDEAQQRLREWKPEAVLTSDGKVRDVVEGWVLPVELVIRPDSAHIARVALAEYAAGKRVAVEDLDANYCQSDARTVKLPGQAGK